MRINVPVIAASLLLILNSWAGIPQTPTAPTSSAQASTALSQSAKALTGATAVNDVTLTGTVEWIVGSDDESGTATYKGLPGAYRLDMSFRNGTRSEIATTINGVVSGSWIGLDGISHAMANHNMMVEPGWFPIFAVESLFPTLNTVLTYVGSETRNGEPVIHISSSQLFADSSGADAALMQHLTQADIFLDSTTLLPVSYIYTTHPDKNALLDIPIELRYSNYQIVSGLQIPLHVQKYINNTLAIDLQFQNTSLNTGMTPAQISAQ